MISDQWHRWIFASVAKHFTEGAALKNLASYVDGDDRAPLDKHFIEVRMDGPRITEHEKNNYNLYVLINVVVQSVMGKQTLTHFDNIGVVQTLFTPVIEVYKIGETDPPDLLGCLRIVQGGKNGETLRTNNLGQIDKTVRLQQATVEGHYHMDLVGV